jgi:hypothetical protein
MDQTQQTEQIQSSQLPTATTDSQARINDALDSATLAATQIAHASGIQSLEALATQFVSMQSRLGQIEQAIPEVLAVLNDLKLLVPQTFVTRVEAFFSTHFPGFAANSNSEPNSEPNKTE